MRYFTNPLKTGDIYVHAQTVCTSPRGGGPGNEARVTLVGISKITVQDIVWFTDNWDPGTTTQDYVSQLLFMSLYQQMWNLCDRWPRPEVLSCPVLSCPVLTCPVHAQAHFLTMHAGLIDLFSDFRYVRPVLNLAYQLIIQLNCLQTVKGVKSGCSVCI